MKAILVSIYLFFTTISIAQNTVQISDLELLKGNWSGELMYINYSDNREVTLRSTLQIEIKKDKLIGKIGYTDEPSANGKFVIKLKENGTFINNEEIITKSKLDNNSLKIVTKYDGKDNDKPATIFITYVFDNTHFSMTKEVLFENTTERFVRNKYTYKKL
ncbi:hypothetical protein [Aquimarina mytili]|uniref:DUF4488 domain-containing protein n=1 Tax=Aquimarina mytili TaxID=874423 RepID=A0A937D4P9_9FLAO|nr:hypothetical protein [Aquimarina mytili]MBL0682434.1 hypothetical protein [Aquimarina mytili]